MKHVRRTLTRTTTAALIMAALAAGSGTLTAQSPGMLTGMLTGTITDAQGGALPGAHVVIRRASGQLREATTGPDGRFAVRDIPPGGPYTVTVSLVGFAPQERGEVFVTAGGTSRVDLTLAVAAVSESVVVRAGSDVARDRKRAAPSIMDVVSADSVGRFPDANAAEALRRIPGVSMEIDQGEGRFVVVRGIDASLNNVTLNGQVVGTPAEFGTRGVSMDSVPADLVSRLEVVKAVRPDMDANAIAASINIVTLGAFDLPGGFLFGSLRTGYNDLSGNAPFTASASFGRVLGADQRWGLVLGASHSQRQYESELFRVADRWATFGGASVPQNQAFFLYDIDRRRTGINGSLEFRPTKGHALVLRTNYNRFEDTEGRQQTELDLTRGTLSNQTATSGRFSHGRATREYRDYTQTHSIAAAMLAGNHELGASGIDWKAGASRGERDTPNRVDWEFRSAANAFPNEYDVSDPELVRVTPAESFYSPAAYPFRRVRFREDLEREDVLTGEFNLRRAVAFGERAGYWKAGAKVVSRDKTQDRTNENYNAASPGFTLADFGLGGVGPSDFFRGHFRFGPTLNLAALQQFFEESPARFRFDAVSTAQNSVEQDFTADEQVYAGYGMVGMDFRGGNVMAGVRVEATRAEYAAQELVFADGDFTGRTNPARGSAEYTDVLPGVHVNFFPAKGLTIRAAWTNTIGRPAYAELAPISELDEVQESDGTFIGSLSTGNSALKPYESMNFDLSVEYYLPAGLLSIAPFYKRIENPIYGRSIITDNFVHNQRTYARFSLSRPENADNGRIGGVEFNYQTDFTALPAPFDGLGTSLNYTWTTSSVTVFGRDDDLPFFRQSDHIGNAALLYRRNGIEAQVSLSFQGPSLVGVGPDSDRDIYADWYTPVDAKVSFPLPRRLRGFVEGRNLNDVRRQNYQGVSTRRTADEWYSRDVYFGIDWRF